MPDYFKTLRILSSPAINSKSTGATQIHLTENGTQKFYTIAVSIECSTATAITVGPSVSIGTNAASYNNIIPITAVTTLISTSLQFPVVLNVSSSVISANTGIFVNVTTAAVGTSQNIIVHLIGFYV